MAKVRLAIELKCNPPIHQREIHTKQPICRDVLEHMWYAQICASTL